MASINFNPFNESWFRKPPKIPFQPIHLVSSFFKPHSKTPNFASISNPFRKKPEPVPVPDPEGEAEANRILEQWEWECENLPDYRYAPEVEKILQEDPIFEKKENPTQEEIEENEKWWAEFRSSPIVKFLVQAEKIADKLNEMDLEANKVPYHSKDKKLWQSVPHVKGLDGRPMPRRAIKTETEAYDRFWDFAKQFFFGLWGYRQRPYPPCKPIDVAQAIGYKKLEWRYYDFIMKTGGWYYKDRLGRTRGPCELIQLKTAWGAGIIDKHTFIWGEDLDEWAPISMIYGMERAIATWEVRIGAAYTAFLHKLQKGMAPWVPLKGFEDKSYKQVQEEAYESKRRDVAVLEANGGIWPGVRIPSHAMFLWAGGSELTTLLEEDHMPNKYIPKDLRQQLNKAIPNLRPWEILSLEQAMDHITYGGEWYREDLGHFTTGPPYIHYLKDPVVHQLKRFHGAINRMYGVTDNAFPGIREAFEEVGPEVAKEFVKRKSKEEEELAKKWFAKPPEEREEFFAEKERKRAKFEAYRAKRRARVQDHNYKEKSIYPDITTSRRR